MSTASYALALRRIPRFRVRVHARVPRRAPHHALRHHALHHRVRRMRYRRRHRQRASASATAASAAATTASASATPSTPAASTAAAASTSNRRAGCCDDQCRYESYRNELGYFRHDDLLSLFNLAGDRVQCVRPNCVPFCRANWFAKRGVQQKLIGGLAELKVLGMAPEMSEAAIASFRWQSEHERNPDERS
jgi:hypothetical protein